jgi:hypothetical protein
MKNAKMNKWAVVLLLTSSYVLNLNASLVAEKSCTQYVRTAVFDVKDSTPPALVLSPIVDFEAYLDLVQKVKIYRENRLISIDTFNAWSLQPDVIILDTRSDSLYNKKHIAGAIHLNFSDFTQFSLNGLIPNPNTKILIYCNNNFKSEIPQKSQVIFEPAYFTSKVSTKPVKFEVTDSKVQAYLSSKIEEKPPTLALNIPTFINLVGYGFVNIYELGEQLFVNDSRLKFEGSAVPK